ncbi:MAG: metal-dependent transcriptional regulator [Candidatus Bipolaricaulia bacterium]
MRGKNEELKEEILEMLWVADEEDRVLNRDEIIEQLDRPDEDQGDALVDLVKERLLTENSTGEFEMTSEGSRRARKVIRRHRLAERLLNDVLEMDPSSIEGPACQFEHAISAEVEEKICTLLGHPGECPHGKAIPPGKCCTESKQIVSQAIVPLTEVATGQTVRVAYLTLNEEGRLSRLSSLGILPGEWIKVGQKFPAFVVELEETSVAMEEEVARNVFVRNGNSETGSGSSDTGPSSFLKKITKKLG